MIRLLRNTLLFICSLLAAPLCAAIKAVRGKNEPAAAHVVVSVPAEQVTLDDIMGYDPSDPADRMSRKRHHVALKRALHDLYPSQLSVCEKELQLKAILDYTLNTANELVHRGIYGKKKASQAVSNLFTAARAQVTKTFDAGDTICTKALNFLKALQSHTSNRVLHNASKKIRRFWAGITAGGISIAGLFGWFWWRHKQSKSTSAHLHQSSVATTHKPLHKRTRQHLAPFQQTTPPPHRRQDLSGRRLKNKLSLVTDQCPATIASQLHNAERRDRTDSQPGGDGFQQTTPPPHRQQNLSGPRFKTELSLVIDQSSAAIDPQLPDAERRDGTNPQPGGDDSPQTPPRRQNLSGQTDQCSAQQLSTMDLLQVVGRTGIPLVRYMGGHALEAERISPGVLAALTSGWWAVQTAVSKTPSAGTAIASIVATRALYQNRDNIGNALFPTPDHLAANGNPHPQAAALLRGGATVLAVTGSVVTAYYYTPEVLSNALGSALNSGAALLQSSYGQTGLVVTSLAAENFDRLRAWSPRVNNAAQVVSRFAEDAWSRVPEMPWWLGGRRERVVPTQDNGQ